MIKVMLAKDVRSSISHFDPLVLEAFLDNHAEFNNITDLTFDFLAKKVKIAINDAKKAISVALF